MTLRCCICEFSDDTDEKSTRKRDRKLPLVKKPTILLLPFVNSYNWICQICNEKNREKLECVKKSTSFCEQDVLKFTEAGEEEMVKLVVAQMGNQVVNFRDPKTNENGMHLCARLGYWHLARFLIRSGCSFDDKNHLGHTPLTIATSNPNRDDIIEILCKAGADVNYMCEDTTQLMRACVSGQDRGIDILHRYGARLEERTTRDGRTALIKASMWGEEKCVKALLRAGCDPKRRDFFGKTALMYSNKRRLLDTKYEEICRVLLHATNKKDAVVDMKVMQVDIVDTSGDTWRSGYDKVCNSVFYTNLRTHVSTYEKPKTVEEVIKEEQERRKKAELDCEENNQGSTPWEQHYDELAEASYYYNRENGALQWERPEGIDPKVVSTGASHDDKNVYESSGYENWDTYEPDSYYEGQHSHEDGAYKHAYDEEYENPTAHESEYVNVNGAASGQYSSEYYVDGDEYHYETQEKKYE